MCMPSRCVQQLYLQRCSTRQQPYPPADSTGMQIRETLCFVESVDLHMGEFVKLVSFVSRPMEGGKALIPLPFTVSACKLTCAAQRRLGGEAHRSLARSERCNPKHDLCIATSHDTDPGDPEPPLGSQDHEQSTVLDVAILTRLPMLAGRSLKRSTVRRVKLVQTLMASGHRISVSSP
jgi:hypothetical protein